MRKVALSILLLLPLLFLACEKNSDDPDEYNPETQLKHEGVIWDKYLTKEFCTYAEALELAEKAGKRLPTEKEVKDLFFACANDLENSYIWAGSARSTKDPSKDCIGLKLIGMKTEAGELLYQGESVYIWIDQQEGLYNSYCITPINKQEPLFNKVNSGLSLLLVNK